MDKKKKSFVQVSPMRREEIMWKEVKTTNQLLRKTLKALAKIEKAIGSIDMPDLTIKVSEEDGK